MDEYVLFKVLALATLLTALLFTEPSITAYSLQLTTQTIFIDSTQAFLAMPAPLAKGQSYLRMSLSCGYLHRF